MAGRRRRSRAPGNEQSFDPLLLVLVLGMVLGIGGCLYAVGQFTSSVTKFDFDRDFDLDLNLGCGSLAGEPTSITTLDPLAVNRDTAVWSAALSATPSSPPVVAGTQIFVRTRDGGLAAFDTATGTPQWSVTLGGRSLLGMDFAPVVDDGTIFITGWDGSVRAIDSASGTVRWTALGQPGRTAPTSTSRRVSPSPGSFGGVPITVDDHRVYVDGQNLVALDRDTGAQQWSAPVANQPLSGYSKPIVVNEQVIVGGGDGRVDAFDRATGARRWSTPAVGAAGALLAAPTLAAGDGVVYATAPGSGTVVALDAETGAQRWSHGIGTVNRFGSSPVVGHGVVAVAGDAFSVLDPATGEQLVQAPTGGPAPFNFAPAPSDATTVFVPGGDGLLHAISVADGSTQWIAGRSRHTKCNTDPAAIPPALTDRLMIVASGDKHLYAYDR